MSNNRIAVTSRRGLFDMLLASLLFSLMNACVYGVKLFEPEMSSVIISFMRIFCNLLVLLMPALVTGRTLELLGDRRLSLWLRGLFGTLALMLSFSSISQIGPGESAFLSASSGVFVALMGPFILGQKNTWLIWLAILGSFAGVWLLFAADTVKNTNALFEGRAMALASGFLAALAYLMVARAGRSNAPQSVVFYFCLVALLIHLGYFGIFGYQLPTVTQSWGLLVAAGLLGSGAQLLMTRAYQTTPAALVSAVGYLAPVFSLAWGVMFFSQIPSHYALLGSLLILVFGVLLPFLR